ncbi:lantibiotic dehydratase, partial [Streptomyces turgidiscabies]
MPRGTSAAAGSDLTFDVTGPLPATVGEHAVIALQALRELSPAWDVPQALSQWARDFTARFGPTTEVALPAV